MTKRMIIMLVLVGIVLGGVFGWGIVKGIMIKKYMASMSAPVQTVSTIVATPRQWQPQLEAVGSVRAVKGADISSELPGIIEAIYVDSSSNVKEGTLLIKLRVADDMAKLRALEAAAVLAKSTYERDVKQLQVSAVSQATMDSDRAALANANAQVAEQKAIVNKKFILAPFSGHLGIRQVDVGQYVNAGTQLVTLQQLDQVYIDFFLPQQALAQLSEHQKIIARSDTYPGKEFVGSIAGINPKVDTATRNVQIRAVLDNADHKLLPGMYATVDIEISKPIHHVTLPQTAITYNPYGNTVFVVRAKGKDDKGAPKLIAEQGFVTTGSTMGDQVAILSGVRAGDTVVTSGQMKLQNGSQVMINNSVIPSNDAHPSAGDQ